MSKGNPTLAFDVQAVLESIERRLAAGDDDGAIQEINRPWPGMDGDIGMAVKELAMPPVTLYRWLKHGRLKARQETAAGHPVWLIQADAAELAWLKSWRAESRSRGKPGAAT